MTILKATSTFFDGRARYVLQQTCSGSQKTCGKTALDCVKPMVVCGMTTVSLRCICGAVAFFVTPGA